jgi:hypothetical protein
MQMEQRQVVVEARWRPWSSKPSMSWGPCGYGIARRIEPISGDLLAVNQGTLYPVLLKLGQEGAIASDGGPREQPPGALRSTDARRT